MTLHERNPKTILIPLFRLAIYKPSVIPIDKDPVAELTAEMPDFPAVLGIAQEYRLHPVSGGHPIDQPRIDDSLLMRDMTGLIKG